MNQSTFFIILSIAMLGLLVVYLFSFIKLWQAMKSFETKGKMMTKIVLVGQVAYFIYTFASRFLMEGTIYLDFSLYVPFLLCILVNGLTLFFNKSHRLGLAFILTSPLVVGGLILFTSLFGNLTA